MSFVQKLIGWTSGNGAEVDATNRLKVNLALGDTPAEMGGVRFFSENDTGDITGEAKLLSPETDDDYRLRTSADTLLDSEVYNYTAQNTGKHMSAAATMTNAWNAAGMQTNASGITTTTTGVSHGTWAMFPLFGATETYFEFEGSFDAQPTTNTIIDFGGYLRGAANPYAPTDGVYFRLTSAGLKGVINNNGTETDVAFTTPFTYANNEKHQFIVVVSQRKVEFWIDNALYGSTETPVGQGQPFMSAAVPVSWRHAIVGGAAGAVLKFTLNSYSVSLGGPLFADTLGDIGNRMLGSYQGLSGGTMGSLANYANSANPTAAVPTNTTAALGVGLGGQFWETDTLAVTTDGIIASYQVPAGTANVQGRRLRLNGVTIDSYVQTALTGGGYIAQWSLAFGHTAVSLATAEAVAAKAPRRVPLGVQTVASGAVALTQLSRVQQVFQNPIYVNPGEFIAFVKKKVGTAPSAGVVAHVITPDYSWG